MTSNSDGGHEEEQINQLVAENSNLREEIEELREKLVNLGQGDDTLGLETGRDSITMEEFERRMAEI